MKYDLNNIFAKILRNEIPCQKVYENDLPNGVNVIQNSIEADYYLEN